MNLKKKQAGIYDLTGLFAKIMSGSMLTQDLLTK